MSFKRAAPLLVLTLASTCALAQQTGTTVGRTPGSAAANNGLRAVRVIPPPPTCAPAGGISAGANNEPLFPEIVFSRMELLCLRHSDGRFEELPKATGGLLSPDGSELAYWNSEQHDLHLRSIASGSDTVVDSLPDLTPKEMFWSAKGRALVYPVNNANPLCYRVLDLDSGMRSIVERGLTRIVGAPDPQHLLGVGQNGVERISVSDGKHEVLAAVEFPGGAQYSPSGALLGILVPGPGGREAVDDDTPDCTGGTFALLVQKTDTRQLREIPFPNGFDSVLDFDFSPGDDALVITFGREGCDYPGEVARIYIASFPNLAFTPLSPADRLSVQAHWSPDGKTIVYSDYTGNDLPLIAVDAHTGKTTRLTSPGPNGPDTFISWR